MVFANSTGTSCVPIPTKYNYGNFFLNDAADKIQILNGTVVIDHAIYNSLSGWPVQVGKSVNLDPDLLDASSNDAAASWCSSTLIYAGSDAGSPGAANEQCF